jgi:S-adenosylmethionine synthetase
MSTFITSQRNFLTSESVTEGHPDKLCDQVSDAILDALLAEDPYSRVACETSTTTGVVWVFGEVTSEARVDYSKIVRETVARIGYTSAETGFDAGTCAVMTALKQQSPDIAEGVDHALEFREGDRDQYDRTGAGDQGMMIGFACNETDELMPMPIALAHRLCRKLAVVRKDGSLPFLRPDGKAQVTVEYEYGRPRHIETVVISTQHDETISNEELKRQVMEMARSVLPAGLVDQGRETKFIINPTGRFVIGGPMGDAGLTGRKIIVDTYGGAARHGGGAFSGKDPTKVDRSAAYYARYVAKNIVKSGMAERIELQVAYAIGVAHPLSIMIETFGTERVSCDRILELINSHFDFRPASIIESLRLRRPIYEPTAAYGHFGRDDIDAPWEDSSMAGVLKEAAGLNKVPVAV